MILLCSLNMSFYILLLSSRNFLLNCTTFHQVFTLSVIFVLLSHEKKMGAANDYHTSNLQLTKERSWLITPYNVHQPVLQALRYIMFRWEGDSVS